MSAKDQNVIVESKWYREESNLVIGRDKVTGETYAYIRLENPANVDSVKVIIGEEQCFPKRFNDFGEPIFDNEFYDMLCWKYRDSKKQGNAYEPRAVVEYQSPEILQSEIDSVDNEEEIKIKIRYPKKFWELLKARKILAKGLTGTEISLSDYVICGRWLLSASGNMYMLKEKYKISTVPPVCAKKNFLQVFHAHYGDVEENLFLEVYDIPKNNVCPLCAKLFTAEDIEEDNIKITGKKIAHKSCVEAYETRFEIDQIIDQIISKVYESYNYEIIAPDIKEEVIWENIPYSNYFLTVSKPGSRVSFRCHTHDGDIIIGRYGTNTIVIEWLDNFKPFDMSVFYAEDVSKWNRGIVADGIYSARKYLQTAKDIVNWEPIP